MSEDPRVVRFIDTENRRVGGRGRTALTGESSFRGGRVLIGEDEKVLKMLRVMA